MGLKHAYDSSDAGRRAVSILDWLARHRGKTPRCLICNEDLLVKGEHSLQVDCYFSHQMNSSCPTILSKPPTSYLLNAPMSPGASHASRDYARENLLGVYMEMRGLAKGLGWLDLETACDVAKQKKVWDLVGITPEFLPAILLSCLDVWTPRGSTGPVTYFLEPSATPGSHWNFGGAKKSRLYEVDIKTGDIKVHPIGVKLPKSNVISRIEKLLI